MPKVALHLPLLQHQQQVPLPLPARNRAMQRLRRPSLPHPSRPPLLPGLLLLLQGGRLLLVAALARAVVEAAAAPSAARQAGRQAGQNSPYKQHGL
jgi:hypothetical protein